VITDGEISVSEKDGEPNWIARCRKCKSYSSLTIHQIKRIPARWRKDYMWTVGVCISEEEKKRRLNRPHSRNWSH